MRIHRFVFGTLVFWAGLGVTAVAAARSVPPLHSPPARMTFTAALEQAARNRPELISAQADLAAADLRLRHAGLPPNPDLGVEWDNLGGDRPADESRETTVSLSQPVEIGGKPSARKEKIRAEIQRLQHEQTVAWLDLAVEVRMAFIEVLNARERLALQNEAEKTAADQVSMTREQVLSGKIAGTEETRARAKMAETRAETHKLQRLLAEAERNLGAVLSLPADTPVTAEGMLTREVPVPDRDTLLAEMKRSPLVAVRRSETLVARTNLSLEQANAWSDPTLSLAVREVPDEDARAVAVGFSIPLPLFQRNQASLADAEAMTHKATANEAAATRRLHTEVFKAHELLVAADREARTLQADGLGRAAEAAAAVQQGFRAGKFRYSDVLEASQSLLTMKNRHLDALLDLNRAAITLDRLLGKPALPVLSTSFSPSSVPRSTP